MELIELIKTEPQKAINLIKNRCFMDFTKIKNLKSEFDLIDRNLRDTQIGKVQKDKMIGEGEKRKKVSSVRIPVPFQNKIVTTSTAFEVGEPVSLVPSEANDLTEEIERLWEANRVDSSIMKMVSLRKSELQSALLFYIKDVDKNKTFNKKLGSNKNKEIKTKVLENKYGVMSPYFDEYGDMKLFMWEFTLKDEENKEIKHAWIYDETKVYKLESNTGKMELMDSEDHGFSKIPIVYTAQDKPEWHISEKMIDRLEVSLSKLGGANDYAGHPILKLYGEVEGAPDKDEDGKAFRLEQKETDDGKIVSSDVDFLTHDNAPESVKLELDRLEKYIYSLSSTPDISFDNIKGLGTISGVAIKLMFLDAMIKATMNNTSLNQPMIERIINVFISGTIETRLTDLKKHVENTYIKVQFNSIIPDDIKETIETYASAVDSGIMSVETAIKKLDLVKDVQKEMEKVGK